MDFTELRSPERREKLLSFDDFHYPVTSVEYLVPPIEVVPADFFQVLMGRESRREFADLDLDQLSALLWHSAKTSKLVSLEKGHKWSHRPYPSGGGRHPIDHIIFRHDAGKWKLQVYDPIAHALGMVSVKNETKISEFVARISEMMDLGSAAIIWNVAQFKKTLSVYEDGSSLIYRDEGAVQATFGLVAEALKLNLCILGISGEPFISEILQSKELIRGIGGFLVGGRAQTATARA